MDLTIVSYNIHSGIGTDGRFDLERIGRVLEEIAPDVVALQEAGDFRGRTPGGNHPEVLAKALGLRMAYGPNVTQGERSYGNAVLSRLPILKSRNYDLSVPHREPRGALRCDLDLEGAVLHLFCLHLGLTVGERRQQESLLLSADILRDAVRSDPVVVCGDFNYWGNGPVPGLVRSAIQDAAHMLDASPRTYHSKFPFMRFDRMYVDEGVRPLSLRAHRSALSKVASDHLPLVMRCQTPTGPPRQASAPVQVLG